MGAGEPGELQLGSSGHWDRRSPQSQSHSHRTLDSRSRARSSQGRLYSLYTFMWLNPFFSFL